MVRDYVMITSFFIQANRSSYEDYQHAKYWNGDGTPAEEISLLFELSRIHQRHTYNLITQSCRVQEVSSEWDVSVGSNLHFRKM